MHIYIGERGMAGDYGVLAVAVCVYVYTVYASCVLLSVIYTKNGHDGYGV